MEVNFLIVFYGFCMIYLSESFRKEFNNIMFVNFLWEVVYVFIVIEFEVKVLEIEEML